MTTTAPKKILLVDDEAEILDVYGSKFREAGYTVILAADGAEGLIKARNEKPDLILLDLKMPVMNGVEMFEKMYADPELKKIKVVFLTAFSDPLHPEADERYAAEIGATDFIRKGLDLNELVAKVKGYLGD